LIEFLKPRKISRNRPLLPLESILKLIWNIFFKASAVRFKKAGWHKMKKRI